MFFYVSALPICYFPPLQRDEEDIIQSVRNCQPEFKEYYIQMYSAKRSQAPLLSQVIQPESPSCIGCCNLFSTWLSISESPDLLRWDAHWGDGVCDCNLLQSLRYRITCYYVVHLEGA